MIDVLSAEFALAEVAIATISVVGVILMDHAVAVLARHLERGKIWIERLIFLRLHFFNIYNTNLYAPFEL